MEILTSPLAMGSLSLSVALDTIPPCVGKDDFGHRLFLVTNEKGQEKTLSILAKKPITGNVAIGVSGFFTLNAVAVRGRESKENTADIDTIIMIDRSIRVEHFWQHMQGIMRSSRSKEEVVIKIIALINDNARLYFRNDHSIPPDVAARSMISNFINEIRDSKSWLSNDISFHKVKKIFDNGGFIFKRMDLLDFESFAKVADSIADNELSIDFAYISNVAEYVDHSSKFKYFLRSVSHITQPETLVIQTRPRPCVACCPLVQCIRKTHGAPAKDLFLSSVSDPCGHRSFFTTPENTGRTA
ncbi:MAG: hypothetical protein HY860_03545 [Chlamydiales bacterium]|nr:hypothetical protein [Chlamydiales bacterium]